MSLANIVEEGIITFSNSASETHLFTSRFTLNPNVILTISSENAVFAKVVSISTSGFSVETTSNFTGNIYFRAVGS